MKTFDFADLEGKTLAQVEPSRMEGYPEVFGLLFVFTDGTEFRVAVDEVHYDQFSSTPVLSFQRGS